MALTIDEKIAIYQGNLAKYEAQGNVELADIQRRLIKRLDADKKGGE